MKKIIKRILPWLEIDKKIYRKYLRAHKYFLKNYQHIVEYYNYKMYKKYNCIISGSACIEPGLSLPHPVGIIIGREVKIGKNATIYQGVTLGQKNNKYPIVGDNVTIYAGAKIIGDVTIGNNVIVGANAVVIHDVPDNCVVAGVPAKIIKRLENEASGKF